MRCIFCEYINGKTKFHKKGYPFITNYKTKNTLSFISLDSPVNDEPHIIIIPKKHNKNFHDSSEQTFNELIEHLMIVGKYFSNKGLDYNILLNNGIYAGQKIMHTHFHVIPRKKNDEIKVEVWERKKISSNDFIELAEKTKKEFSAL